jgi:hypothetical protein
MSRLLIVITAVLIAIVAMGLFVLGAFPPKPHRAPVEHVIPNDRFKSP